MADNAATVRKCVDVVVKTAAGAKPMCILDGKHVIEACAKERYVVKLTSKVKRPLGVVLFIDDQRMLSAVLKPEHTLPIAGAITKSVSSGGMVQYSLRPFVFSRPKFVDESDAEVSESMLEKLGTICVEVFEAEAMPPKPMDLATVSQEAMVRQVTEEQGINKGAFLSNTTLGEEHVIEKPPMFATNKRGSPVGSIVINYASRAAMLFQGVPAAWFITQDEKAQRGEDRNQESGDDDDDHQPCHQPGQKRSYPPPNPTPRSSIRLALKRVKTEPSQEG